MFQRLKGAIDSRIAEEQARQRAIAQNASPQRTPSGSIRKTPSRTASPAKRLPRSGEKKDASIEKGPDPSEFEPEFVIGDDESAVPSGTATPRKEAERSSTEGTNGNAKEISQNETMQYENEGKETDTEPSEYLPAETVQKLKKLDRLEGRYQELLKAYRTAHARVSTIEPFEKALREATPLTSINDPASLAEYLNQLNLKSDMVLDELKRVSGERDEFKKKSEASDATISELKEELDSVQNAQENPHVYSDEKDGQRPSLEVSTDMVNNREENSNKSATVHSPTPSQSSRVPSFSFFSPKAKAAKSPPVQEKTEDFFSFDTEVPRLESELQERQTEIEALRTQLDSLKRDLTVARESTESMVQSLESATRELHQLREGRDTFEAEKRALEQQFEQARERQERIQSEKDLLEQQIGQYKADQNHDDNQQSNESNRALQKTLEEKADALRNLEAKLLESNESVESLRSRLSEKEIAVKDLEDTLAMAKSDERQREMARDTQSKRIETINGVLSTVRSQLADAQRESAQLQHRSASRETEYQSSLPVLVYHRLSDEFKADREWLAAQDTVDQSSEFLLKRIVGHKVGDADQGESNGVDTKLPPEAAPSGGSKKKNKKKKKGKGGNETNHPEPPVKVTEDLKEESRQAERDTDKDTGATSLSRQVKELERQLEDKNAAIERLSAKLKDQESLQEEIETLRDVVLEQGQDQVAAKDQVKAIIAEKDALQKSIDDLERQLAAVKASTASGAADSVKAQQALAAEFEELKSKSTALQTDLNAAQQLAAARFKDISDLRDVLSKVQPELRKLRQENKDLVSSKEDFKNKVGELHRLESRHEDLKAEMKGLSKRLGDKDVEIKSLQQESSTHITTCSKLESELQMTQSDLRSAINSKQSALESHEAALKDLSRAKEDTQQLRSERLTLSDEIDKLRRETETLQEEIQLKTAQHASAESLMSSMRDQTSEISTQMRESSARAEALEEELTETQRMLSERSREGDTMRRLLNDVETSSERKLREMKERMENATEERDRAEDEASTTGRRLAREIEDLKTKARDSTRALKRAEEERDELEHAQADWRRRRGTLEEQSERTAAEMTEMRNAIAQLRDALDESERNAQEIERQKAEFRKAVEENHQRLDKLQKNNKNLAEEVKVLQQSAKKQQQAPSTNRSGTASGVPSSRSSIESTSARATPGERIGSPVARDRRAETTSKTTAPNIDYVYLKNVLLQFLEQKDKTHQKQLIPVLGMLLHFDRADEQKWMTAISTR